MRLCNSFNNLSKNLNIHLMKLTKNILMEGIFSVETPDTSGEVLNVEGADISDLQTGKAPLNTEHINPEDAEEVRKDEKNKGFEGFNSIIGRVVNAKKIFSQDDCGSDRERAAWSEFKKPMIYGAVEIWDGPDAHDNARAAAAIARMFSKSQEGPQLGLSVEGATIKREGNQLKRTVIRKMALTMKPANKAATVDIVSDSSAPRVSKSVSALAYEGGQEPLRKSISMTSMHIDVPVIPKDFGLSDALASLRKALTAGTPSAAPSSLSGGEALQGESQLAKLVKLFGNKPPSRGLLKAKVPGISDEMCAKVESYFKKRELSKNMKLTETAYAEMLGKNYKK